MAKVLSRPTYPLAPLLGQFRSTIRASLPITTDASTVRAFDDATDEQLADALRRIADHALPVCYHPAVFLRTLPFLRHALAHLLRGQDPLPDRLARCVTPGEAYHVPGVGLGVWSAIIRVPDESTTPLWCPAIERGLRALGLFPENPITYSERFAAVLTGCERIREAAPDLTASQISDFLERVSRMTGRELPILPGNPVAFAWGMGPDEIRRAIREVRTRLPLRKRLRETPRERIDAITQFQMHAASEEFEAAFEAFRAACPDPAWETALPQLDDAYSLALPISERSRLWCEIASTLRESFRIHPLELADVVSRFGQLQSPSERGSFAGLCSDTFAFLDALSSANTREWMTTNRERYQFVLREPLIELCTAVAERYVRPVLNREHGWDLECDTKPGRALTSICKNDFGRSGPYQPVQWVTFYRRSQANKRADAQFFIRITADGVRFGFHLGRVSLFRVQVIGTTDECNRSIARLARAVRHRIH